MKMASRFSTQKQATWSRLGRDRGSAWRDRVDERLDELALGVRARVISAELPAAHVGAAPELTERVGERRERWAARRWKRDRREAARVDHVDVDMNPDRPP